MRPCWVCLQALSESLKTAVCAEHPDQPLQDLNKNDHIAAAAGKQ